MTATTLEQLSEQHGIGRAYHDYRGEFKVFSTATRLALLGAMGVDTSAMATPTGDAGNSPAPSAEPIPRALVVQQGEPVVLRLPAVKPNDATSLAWTLETEGGATESGTADLASLWQQAGPAAGAGAISWTVPFGSQPVAGYHRMSLRIGANAVIPLRLIVTPPQCFQPQALHNDQRLWGITLQLYTLRSSGNWGIGDFGDLMDVIELAAPLGCGLIGLNPLHALFPAEPEHISPYSPSSRQFLNPLYICLPRIPEAQACGPLQRFLQDEGVKQLGRLRASANVDYPRVAALKLHWLRALYEEFRLYQLPADSERARAFRRIASAPETDLCCDRRLARLACRLP